MSAGKGPGRLRAVAEALAAFTRRHIIDNEPTEHALCPEAGAHEDVFLIRDGEGRYLRAWFDGVPDWCSLRSNARRHHPAQVQAALDRCLALGIYVQRVEL